MEPFHYTCPFCNRDTTISSERFSNEVHFLGISNSDGQRALNSIFVVCPNMKCRKFSLNVSLSTVVQVSDGRGPKPRPDKPIKSWRLVPSSAGKLFPDYIPIALRDDYVEACDILDRSPKASATLSRRALQGMIRDFHEIKEKRRLKDEIDALKGVIGDDVWEAINAVRKVGNIGAHMEQDVNVMIDVDPVEAEALIRLVEMLFKEWYLVREERRKALAEVAAIGRAKDAAQLAAKATPPKATS